MAKDPTIITLEGDLDITRRDEIHRLLEPTYESAEAVILDLSAVDYADSTILAALIIARNRRRSKGLSLPRLVITSRRIRRVFSIAGLDQAFPIYETLEEAQAAA